MRINMPLITEFSMDLEHYETHRDTQENTGEMGEEKKRYSHGYSWLQSLFPEG